MTKRAAETLLIQGVTWEQLHSLLGKAETTGTSRVNRRASLAQARTTYQAASAGRAGKVQLWRLSGKRPAGYMIARNILRDFGPPLNSYMCPECKGSVSHEVDSDRTHIAYECDDGECDWYNNNPGGYLPLPKERHG